MTETEQIKKHGDYIFEKLVLKTKIDEDTDREVKVCQLYTLEFDAETFMNEYPCPICKNMTSKHEFPIRRNQVFNRCKASKIVILLGSFELGQPWIKIIGKKKMSKADVVQYLRKNKQVPEPDVALFLVSS
jgi:hypothetical protein